MPAISFKQRLHPDRLLAGTLVFEFFTPGIAQLCKAAGADFILYDMEHSGASIETIKQQCSYCRGLDIAPLVRVPVTEYHFIARALDAGAHGIMIPMVESVEQARHAVACTRYWAGSAARGVRRRARTLSPGRSRRQDRRRRGAHLRHRTDRNTRGCCGRRRNRWSGHRRHLGRTFRPHQFHGDTRSVRTPRLPGRHRPRSSRRRRNGKPAGFMALDQQWATRYYGGLDSGSSVSASTCSCSAAVPPAALTTCAHCGEFQVIEVQLQVGLVCASG